jgi:hypothetical protein
LEDVLNITVDHSYKSSSFIAKRLMDAMMGSLIAHCQNSNTGILPEWEWRRVGEDFLEERRHAYMVYVT